MAGRAGGDSWGQVAPPKHVSETKNKAPQENHGKDYAEGEGKRALRHHGSLCLAFQGTGLSLLLYDLVCGFLDISFASWTPRIGGCWLCVTMGGRMRKGGMCFNLCLYWTSPLPRQGFTSSMELVPSLALGLGSKPCKAPGAKGGGVGDALAFISQVLGQDVVI